MFYDSFISPSSAFADGEDPVDLFIEKTLVET